MTSEEFAKKLAGVGAVFEWPPNADVFQLAKDYLALLAMHGVFQRANDNLSRAADERAAELRSLREEVKRLRPVEYEYATVPANYLRARHDGVCATVVETNDLFTTYRWPKERT